jgi:hypothetical protein
LVARRENGALGPRHGLVIPSDVRLGTGGFEQRCSNGRFPIRKRPLRMALLNGRSWPIVLKKSLVLRDFVAG